MAKQGSPPRSTEIFSLPYVLFGSPDGLFELMVDTGSASETPWFIAVQGLVPIRGLASLNFTISATPLEILPRAPAAPTDPSGRPGGWPRPADLALGEAFPAITRLRVGETVYVDMYPGRMAFFAIAPELHRQVLPPRPAASTCAVPCALLTNDSRRILEMRHPSGGLTQCYCSSQVLSVVLIEEEEFTDGLRILVQQDVLPTLAASLTPLFDPDAEPCDEDPDDPAAELCEEPSSGLRGPDSVTHTVLNDPERRLYSVGVPTVAFHEYYIAVYAHNYTATAASFALTATFAEKPSTLPMPLITPLAASFRFSFAILQPDAYSYYSLSVADYTNDLHIVFRINSGLIDAFVAPSDLVSLPGRNMVGVSWFTQAAQTPDLDPATTREFEVRHSPACVGITLFSVAVVSGRISCSL